MISMDLLYITIITTFVMIKLSGVLAESIDPFQPLEQILTTLALGGLWDNMEEEQEEGKEEVVAQEEDVVEQEEEKVIVTPDGTKLVLRSYAEEGEEEAQ